MPGNATIFLCLAPEDRGRCAPLLAALAAWNVDYWVDMEDEHSAAGDLSDRIVQAIAEHEVFLRVCTRASASSPQVRAETAVFFKLLTVDRADGREQRRRLVSIRLDTAYDWQPFEPGTLRIDASVVSPRTWMAKLRRMLGLAVIREGRLEIHEVEEWFAAESAECWIAATGYGIQGVMLTAFRTMGAMGILHGLTALGLPIEDERELEGGVIVQRFERGTLTYDPKRMYDCPPGVTGDHYLAHVNTPHQIV